MTKLEKVIDGLERTAQYFHSMRAVGYHGDVEVYKEHERHCNDALDLLKAKPKRESRAKLPCPCGNKRISQRKDWMGMGKVVYCEKCGRDARGDTEMDAIRAWNRMVQDETD